nr:MAG TPA: hypothetical protein [Bacteriophage sp.]
MSNLTKFKSSIIISLLQILIPMCIKSINYMLSIALIIS